MNYATYKKNRARLCWASRLPSKNERLESAIEATRGPFFTASVVMVLPNGEIRAVQVSELGRRLQLRGRGRPVVVGSGVFWALAEAMRKADTNP